MVEDRALPAQAVTDVEPGSGHQRRRYFRGSRARYSVYGPIGKEESHDRTGWCVGHDSLSEPTSTQARPRGTDSRGCGGHARSHGRRILGRQLHDVLLRDASNYCTVYSSAPESTASVAQRYNNNIQCANTCHTHVYYYSSGTGSYGFAYTSGGTSASYGASGGGNYVYSRCITDAGYGSNTARCWTEWYT